MASEQREGSGQVSFREGIEEGVLKFLNQGGLVSVVCWVGVSECGNEAVVIQRATS